MVSCPGDLEFTFAPHDTTIAPGEQFTASMSVYGCGNRLSDTITFQSSDLSVAVVGAATGVVIGARPGDATITASAKQLQFDVPIMVHVRQ
ncbi:MAG: Ig-like domain-containing protein [Gemmatimonadaceae bacterium]